MQKRRVIVHTPPPPHADPASDTDSASSGDSAAAKQQKVEQPKLKVNLVKTTSKSASGSTENTVAQPKSGTENGAPQGEGTGKPAPAATVGTPSRRARIPTSRRR